MHYLLVGRIPKLIEDSDLIGMGLEIPVGLAFHGSFDPLEEFDIPNRGYVRSIHALPAIVQIDLVRFAMRKSLIIALQEAKAMPEDYSDLWPKLKYKYLLNVEIPSTREELIRIGESMKAFRSSADWFFSHSPIQSDISCDYYSVAQFLTSSLPLRRWYLSGMAQGKLGVAKTLWEGLRESRLDNGEPFSFELLDQFPVLPCHAGLLLSDVAWEVIKDRYDKSFFRVFSYISGN